MIRVRTDEERKAYIEGYEAGMRAVEERGIEFAKDSLKLMAETVSASPSSESASDGGED